MCQSSRDGVSTVKQTDIITLYAAIARLRQHWWVARKFLQWHKQKFSSIRRTNLEPNTRKERERQWCVRINSVALSTYKKLCAHTRLTLNNIRGGLKWGCTSQFPRKMGIKNIKKKKQKSRGTRQDIKHIWRSVACAQEFDLHILLVDVKLLRLKSPANLFDLLTAVSIQRITLLDSEPWSPAYCSCKILLPSERPLCVLKRAEHTKGETFDFQVLRLSLWVTKRFNIIKKKKRRIEDNGGR